MHQSQKHHGHLRPFVPPSDGGANIPSTREELEKLPGVGRKTANVVLNCAFKQPCMPVDTHVFRVAKRLRIATGKTPLAVEKSLLKNIPQQYLVHAHHWLILHGRYVCQARKPKCDQCFLCDICPSRAPNGMTREHLPTNPRNKSGNQCQIAA